MRNTIIITGAPATGKTTLQEKICENSRNYRRGLDYTTRSIRNGEVNGLTRYFVSKDEFIKLFNSGFFIEPSLDYAEYNGQYYGTPLEIASTNPPKVSVITGLEIARKLKYAFPETIWLHLFANRDHLIQRLIERGEKEDSILFRIDPKNSDLGTFNRIDEADINLNSSFYDTEHIMNFLFDFLNKQES